MEELNMLSKYRILVIGSPGSGKSTLSDTLQEILNIKCYHLDDLYWLENWKRPNESSWIEKINSVLNEEEWIIDGNYYRNFEQRLLKSNFVIYLDYPTYLCAYRVICRAFIRRFISQDSLPIAIRNNRSHNRRLRISLKFTKLVLLFKLMYKRKIKNLLNEYKVKYIQLKSTKQQKIFINHLISHSSSPYKLEGCLLCK